VPFITAMKWIVTDPCAGTRPRWRSGGQLENCGSESECVEVKRVACV
jgi:hypothetical protein